MANSTLPHVQRVLDELDHNYKKLSKNAKGGDSVQVTNFSGGKILYVEKIGPIEDTELVYIIGDDETGRECKVLQHYTQLSIVFTIIQSEMLDQMSSRTIGFLVHSN